MIGSMIFTKTVFDQEETTENPGRRTDVVKI